MITKTQLPLLLSILTSNSVWVAAQPILCSSNALPAISITDLSCSSGGDETVDCADIPSDVASGDALCGNVKITATATNNGATTAEWDGIELFESTTDTDTTLNPKVLIAGSGGFSKTIGPVEIQNSDPCGSFLPGTYSVVVKQNTFGCTAGTVGIALADPTSTVPPTPEQSSGDKRRRRLSKSAKPVDPQDEIYHQHLLQCGLHDYDVFLYVDPAPHIYAILEPKEQAKKAGCPYGATHAITDSNGMFTKEILAFDSQTEFDAMFPKEEDGAYHVGSFSLAELESAFSDTSVGSDEGYNVVNNNCGTYMIKLSAQLGVKPSASMMSFVTRRLLKYSTKDLLNNIRANAASLMDSRQLRTTDDQMIEFLIEESILELN